MFPSRTADVPTMTRVSVRSIRRNDLTSLRRLVQLYLYDLGGSHWNVEANGTFGGPAWHRYFWRRRGRRRASRSSATTHISPARVCERSTTSSCCAGIVIAAWASTWRGCSSPASPADGKSQRSLGTSLHAASGAGSSSVARSVALWNVDAVTALSDSSCSTSRRRKGNVDRKPTQPGRPPQPGRPLLCKRPAAKSSRKRGGPCSAYEGGAGPVALAMRSGRR